MLRSGAMLVHAGSTSLSCLTCVVLIGAALGCPPRLTASQPVQATAAEAPASRPLSRLRTSPMLEALVARMAARSPAFARQCARLERSRALYLHMRLEAPVRHGRYVARSVIKRHEFGAVVADITLHMPPDLVETIAHEFEHAIEQVERLDLDRLSRAKGSGVSRTASGDFETERAVGAGRRIAAEFRDTAIATTAAAAY